MQLFIIVESFYNFRLGLSVLLLAPGHQLLDGPDRRGGGGRLRLAGACLGAAERNREKNLDKFSDYLDCFFLARPPSRSPPTSTGGAASRPTTVTASTW